jgi:hypothetical protein
MLLLAKADSNNGRAAPSAVGHNAAVGRADLTRPLLTASVCTLCDTTYASGKLADIKWQFFSEDLFEAQGAVLLTTLPPLHHAVYRPGPDIRATLQVTLRTETLICLNFCVEHVVLQVEASSISSLLDTWPHVAP